MQLAVSFSDTSASVICTVVGDLAQSFQLQMPYNLPGDNGGGPIASVQPDGKLQGRPTGTAGPFETFAVKGAHLYIYPSSTGDQPSAFLYVFEQVG